MKIVSVSTPAPAPAAAPAAISQRLNQLTMEARGHIDRMIRVNGVADTRIIARVAADYADLRAELEAKTRPLRNADETMDACRKLGPTAVSVIERDRNSKRGTPIGLLEKIR